MEINNFPSLKCKVMYPEHDSSFLNSLTAFHAKDKYLDLVFICKENVCVQANKIVFMTVSELIMNLIRSTNDETVYVSAPDIDSKTVELLQNFIYEGVTKVNLKELMSLKELITILRIRLFNTEIKNLNGKDDFHTLENLWPMANQTNFGFQPSLIGYNAVNSGSGVQRPHQNCSTTYGLSASFGNSQNVQNYMIGNNMAGTFNANIKTEPTMMSSDIYATGNGFFVRGPVNNQSLNFLDGNSLAQMNIQGLGDPYLQYQNSSVLYNTDQTLVNGQTGMFQQPSTGTVTVKQEFINDNNIGTMERDPLQTDTFSYQQLTPVYRPTMNSADIISCDSPDIIIESVVSVNTVGKVKRKTSSFDTMKPQNNSSGGISKQKENLNTEKPSNPPATKNVSPEKNKKIIKKKIIKKKVSTKTDETDRPTLKKTEKTADSSLKKTDPTTDSTVKKTDKTMESSVKKTHSTLKKTDLQKSIKTKFDSLGKTSKIEKPKLDDISKKTASADISGSKDKSNNQLTVSKKNENLKEKKVSSMGKKKDTTSLPKARKSEEKHVTNESKTRETEKKENHAAGETKSKAKDLREKEKHGISEAKGKDSGKNESKVSVLQGKEKHIIGERNAKDSVKSESKGKFHKGKKKHVVNEGKSKNSGKSESILKVLLGKEKHVNSEVKVRDSSKSESKAKVSQVKEKNVVSEANTKDSGKKENLKVIETKTKESGRKEKHVAYETKGKESGKKQKTEDCEVNVKEKTVNIVQKRRK